MALAFQQAFPVIMPSWAPAYYSTGLGTRNAYIYEWDGSSWAQVVVLPNPETTKSYDFGISVNISDDYAIVGATQETELGYAYIYHRSEGAWSLMATLEHDAAMEGCPLDDDNFGYAVDITEDYAIIGARYDYDKGAYAGAAYIYARNGSTWTQVAKLTGSDTAAGDYFGSSVSISGNYAIVGARGNDEGGSAAGAAYVFAWDGSSWTQMAKLLPDDIASLYAFGCSVAISGNNAIVGATRDLIDPEEQVRSGAAYVFSCDGTDWTQVARLQASTPADRDYFGWDVDISGTQVVVGTISSGAFVFSWDGAAWSRMADLLSSDFVDGDSFGNKVGISSGRVIVGAYRAKVDGNADAGAAYVFQSADPTINTSAATDVGQMGATLNGSAYADNLSLSIEFEYGTDTSYGSSIAADPATVTGTSATAVSASLTDLSPETTYHFRVKGTTAGGAILYGGDLSFTTGPASAPSLETKEATSIAYAFARSGGIISSNGGSAITAYGICWSTSSGPTTDDACSSSSGSPSASSFSITLSNLTAGTTYYVRAYATNDLGTGYGSEIEFTTLSYSKPSVILTTSNPYGITSVQIGYSFTDTGGLPITARGVCWSTSPSPTLDDTHTSEAENIIDSTLTGLTPETTYYIRAYATNSLGTSYSEELIFTTSAVEKTKKLEVQVLGDGSGTVVSSPEGINCRGICWEEFDTGTVITLTATADSGSELTSWGSDCSGTGQCTFTLTRYRIVQATFTKKEQTSPTAEAGPDQSVDVNQTVTLDGSNSWDQDGSIVSYAWSTDSSVTINNAESSKASFYPTLRRILHIRIAGNGQRRVDGYGPGDHYRKRQQEKARGQRRTAPESCNERAGYTSGRQLL